MSDSLVLVEKYYEACGRGDADVVRATLRDDVTHYYLAPNIASDPIRSAEHLARKVRKSARMLGARWNVDRFIEQDDRAAIEWAMTWTPQGASREIVTRGCEWFTFSDSRIAEVRSYHQVLTEPCGLDGFPYAARKYSCDGRESSVRQTPGGAPAKSRLPIIIDYYNACTAADADLLQEFFTDDVVHYFLRPNLGSQPVAGAEHLARYWRKVARMLQARWVVESIIEQDDEAIVEWSMYNQPQGVSERIVTRGTEWYVFEGDKIAEIRSYHRNLERSSALADFPYDGRGFSVLGRESSVLHDAAATPYQIVSS